MSIPKRGRTTWRGLSDITTSKMEMLRAIMLAASTDSGGSSGITDSKQPPVEDQFYFLWIMAEDWARSGPKPYVMRGCDYQGPRKRA